MPAYTVAQLEDQLGQYTDQYVPFLKSLAQILPRVYAMGPWKDTVGEVVAPVTGGYVTFPPSVETLLQATIDDLPAPIRSEWADRRIAGSTNPLDPRFGLVDDGLRPTLLEMMEVQDVMEPDIVPVELFELFWAGTATPVPAADFAGLIRLKYTVTNGLGGVAETTVNDSNNIEIDTSAGPVRYIYSINYENVPADIDIKADGFSPVVVTVPAGTGILRHRRYRTSSDATTVRAQVKFRCPEVLTLETEVPLGNLNALKHALLARIAEDNADADRAKYHWSECRGLLEEELDNYRGAAKPTVTLDIWGGNQSSVQTLY